MAKWKGSNPFCLVIMGEDTSTLIDLDEPGWMKAHHDLLQEPGRWVLARKVGSLPVLQVNVGEGEEPYYVSRVVHPVGSVPNCPTCGRRMDWELIEHRSYGIGKKRLDGHSDRLWVMPNGVICGGDDVDRIGHEAVKAASSEMWRSHYASHGRGSGDFQEEGQGGEPQGDRGKGSQGRKRREAARNHGPRDRRPSVRVAPRPGDGDGSPQ